MSQSIRFSLRSLLLVMVLLGLTLAVVMWNSEWLASLCYSMFLMVQCAAIVGAISRTGSARVFWLGFVVFGFGYGLTAFPSEPYRSYWPGTLYRVSPVQSAYPSVGPADITDRLFQLIQSNAKVGDVVSAQWQNAGFYPATVKEVRADGRILVAWTDGTRATLVTKVGIENIHGRIAGQSVVAVLVGLLAAYVCQVVFNPKQPP